MSNLKYLNAAAILVALMVTACGQDSLEWPDTPSTSGGECGTWYPGGDVDGGVETDSEEEIYGVEVGKIFPCLVWNSVRMPTGDGVNDAFIDIGNEYLSSVYELSDKRALVIAVGAAS